MSQFILSVFHAPGVHAAGTAYEDETAMQAAFAKVGAFNEKLSQAGKLVFACGLTPPEQAVVVDGEGGRTDGPYAADAPAFLGGFWIVEAADLDEAVALAQDGSDACGNRLEVRRLQG